MKLQKVFLVLIVSIVSFQISFGQEIDFEGNWFREIKGYDDNNTRYEFKFYTKDDVVKAKRRFNLIKQFPFKDEWEGIYSSGTELGTAELRWSSAGGFVNYYFYHTLRSLDFGSAFDKTDSVELVSEKSPNSKRKSLFSTNLIKVKFGNRHFLVPENRLQDFTDRAVGLNTSLSDFGYYLQKLDESENKVFGLPVLPEKYRRFLRFPIDTKITRIGNRQIHQDKFGDGTVNYEEMYRFVTLGAGKNKKIRIGMNFFVEDLSEWIEITKVLSNSSVGKIRRGFNEKKQEECFDEERGQGQIIPCKAIKVGMKGKTKVSESFF